ncbi:MAG: hypothetical protein ABIB79_01770 [archaeon]
MLKKFLNDVIVLVIGRQVENLSDLLYNKKHVNEFLIAKKLDITINQTRNILYKISDSGLVSSIRKKDKKKGWYTYFWRIEVLKSLEFLKDHLQKRIQQFENQIKSRETKEFYICERCNIEFNEENALLNNFTCNECGSIFARKDNTKVLRELKKNLDKLKKELKLVDVEINKETEKLDKKRLKGIRKREKEKKAARKNAAKKRALLKKKTIEKKKVPKKKSPKKKPVKKKIVKKKVVKKKAKKKKPTKKKNMKKKHIKKPKKISKKTVKKKKK